MWSIVRVQYTLKMKVSCHDQSNQVRFVTKTKHDNIVTDCVSTAYAKNKTKQSWSIGPGAVYDKSQIG